MFEKSISLTLTDNLAMNGQDASDSGAMTLFGGSLATSKSEDSRVVLAIPPSPRRNKKGLLGAQLEFNLGLSSCGG